ncbi:MAG: formate--tetrahydrofolate ligase [Candidatus Coatesbacteria bacterium]|nr:MAG: formate--tetrahydrofolate ligase [Candidatus Coatesbacteria bacterium]
MSTDLEIARKAKLRPIIEVAEELGLSEGDIDLFGRYKAKIHLDVLERKRDKKQGKLILVSAITPTPAGEGKTTTSIGLSMGLARLGERACVALRQPSLGPTMGIKGGAAGGGHSQVLPMEDINLHFTGDIHAVGCAHNLLSAMIDNHIYRRLKPQIDPTRVKWGRVLDMNDRALRCIVIGLGKPTYGVPRESFFDITAASEVMAILCLAENLQDLKKRLGNIMVGYTYNKEPVYARDIKASGAMTVLLRDAMNPNLVQTIEGTPALIHGGPFANIAQGTNSVVATKMGMSLADWCITEAGFGFDLGAEKFFDIKCVSSGLDPHAVVLVATIRALKMHGGKGYDELTEPDPSAVERGLPNLKKHLENICHFKELAIVALNRFATDSEEEIEVVREFCESNNTPFAVSNGWAEGGRGMIELAEVVREVTKAENKPFKPMYDWGDRVEDKIFSVANKIYGAEAVDYTATAKKDLARIYELGFDKLPVCIAKTHKSLSDNPHLLGRPKDFLVTVREIIINSGAGFLVPLTGDIIRMPGLPAVPRATVIDIDDDGNIVGLE